MQMLLMYNIEKKKSIEIKNICRKLMISYKKVENSEYGCSIEYLLGLSDNAESKPGEDFSGEMLLMADFNDGFLNIFLTLLRKRKASVDLKAILTDTNRHFTSYELYKELSAERDAINNGNTYHQA